MLLNRKSLASATAVLALAWSAGAAQADMMKARAEMKDPNGEAVGTVELLETPHGVLLTAQLTNLPAGVHGFHVHETGQCEPPFTSAGGHYNPEGSEHGFLGEGGHHAGDMPNIHVPSSGELTMEVMNAHITLAEGESNSVHDADGSAVVIHAMGDDYDSQPSGDAGARIACGVIR